MLPPDTLLSSKKASIDNISLDFMARILRLSQPGRNGTFEPSPPFSISKTHWRTYSESISCRDGRRKKACIADRRQHPCSPQAGDVRRWNAGPSNRQRDSRRGSVGGDDNGGD
jgi:hypothetical protein